MQSGSVCERDTNRRWKQRIKLEVLPTSGVYFYKGEYVSRSKFSTTKNNQLSLLVTVNHQASLKRWLRIGWRVVSISRSKAQPRFKIANSSVTLGKN